MNFNNLGELLISQAEQYGDRPLYYWHDESLNVIDQSTFLDLYEKANAIATELNKREIKGKMVAIVFMPGLDYIRAFMGCILAGAIPIPMYPPFSRSMIQHMQIILDDAKPKIILTNNDTYGKIKKLRIMSRLTNLPLAKYFTQMKGIDLSEKIPKFNDMEIIQTDSIPDKVSSHLNAEIAKLAFIQYTSGSTGHPKGVMVSHENLLENLSHIKELTGIQPEDSCVLWLPPYHDMGLIGGMLGALKLGITDYWTSPTTFIYKPYTWLKLISDHKATISCAPNFAYDLCLSRISDEEVESLDLSHWRTALNGADFIRHETLKHFADKFGAVGFKSSSFYPCYGLAEATLIVTGKKQLDAIPEINCFQLPIDSDEQQKMYSERQYVNCGTPHKDVIVKIYNFEKEQECIDNEIGEIIVSGKNVSQGYFNKQEISKEQMQVRLPNDEKRYLRTGDLGYLKNGSLYVVGRKKDIIVHCGRNYYPSDIEYEWQLEVPGCRKGAGVIFSLNETEEHRLVVLQEVRTNLPNYNEIAMAIHRVILLEFNMNVDEIMLLPPKILPKTTSGKLKRNEAKAIYMNEELNPLYVHKF